VNREEGRGPSTRLLKVGLTGGIASGKSSVAAMFRELGAPVVDADAIVHELLSAGGPAVEPVLAAFGPVVAAPDGGIDRQSLGRIVFGAPERRKQLERIVHPLVLPLSEVRMKQVAEEAGAAFSIYEAALLVETGRHSEFDRLVVVTTDPETQLTRLMERDGSSADDAGARIRAQLPLAGKVAVADYVIDNSGHWRETRRQVVTVYGALREDAARFAANQPLEVRRA
jgi:dephospho-CoA kinase